jgi:hypothetical protein
MKVKKNENNNPGSYLKLASHKYSRLVSVPDIHGTIINGQVYKLSSLMQVVHIIYEIETDSV